MIIQGNVDSSRGLDAKNQQLIRVLVADDHPVIQEGIVTLLNAQPNLRVVATVNSFPDLWKTLKATQADIVILDIGNMGGPPIMAVEQLRRAWPQLAIIVFSLTVDLAPELLQAGIRGYVVKEDPTSNLVTAIQAIGRGRIFLSAQAQEYLTRCSMQTASQRLTSQELHVLKLLATGQSTNDIADTLGVDVRTIYNYVLKLKGKTGCEDRFQLIDWYRRVYQTDDLS